MHLVMTLALLGVLVSLYALRVMHQKKKKKQYKALCDVNKTVACSDVLTSGVGHIFGAPNALLGLFFYFTIFVLAYLGHHFMILYLSFVAVIISIGLFFLMAFKLKKYCILCSIAYIINLVMLVVSYFAYLMPV